jgi:hypothetical protein
MPEKSKIKLRRQTKGRWQWAADIVSPPLCLLNILVISVSYFCGKRQISTGQIYSILFPTNKHYKGVLWGLTENFILNSPTLASPQSGLRFFLGNFAANYFWYEQRNLHSTKTRLRLLLRSGTCYSDSPGMWHEVVGKRNANSIWELLKSMRVCVCLCVRLVMWMGENDGRKGGMELSHLL